LQNEEEKVTVAGTEKLATETSTEAKAERPSKNGDDEGPTLGSPTEEESGPKDKNQPSQNRTKKTVRLQVD